jgi:cytosine/adenosine deaminase-related metal-dependent hydrolase
VADTVIRQAYVVENDAVVDIAIEDGRIQDIAPEIADEGEVELEANENLVSPGLVDAHVHLDMARSAYNGRQPRNNSSPLDMDVALEKSASYFADITCEEIRSKVQNEIQQAVVNGLLHVRTHAYIDSHVGAKVVECMLDIRNQLDHLIDLDIVAFPQQGIIRDGGSEAAMRNALDAGADLVGGLDPASLNGDRDTTIDTWFDVASDYDVNLDVHIHERDEKGMKSLEQLADQAIETGYEGRVTASHAFALADTVDKIPAAIELFRNAKMSFITCYQSTPAGMPIHEFHRAGLDMAHGTDQIHDLWGAHGNFDPLEAMLVESLKLDGYSTNQGLQTLWKLVTTHGANILRINEYKLEIGTPADLVIHNTVSPQWAILENSTPAYVLKNGKIIAENGAIRCNNA